MAESVWPNRHRAEGVGVNLPSSADPAPLNGGAVILSTAVWLEPAGAVPAARETARVAVI